MKNYKIKPKNKNKSFMHTRRACDETSIIYHGNNNNKNKIKFLVSLKGQLI